MCGYATFKGLTFNKSIKRYNAKINFYIRGLCNMVEILYRYKYWRRFWTQFWINITHTESLISHSLFVRMKERVYASQWYFLTPMYVYILIQYLKLWSKNVSIITQTWTQKLHTDFFFYSCKYDRIIIICIY